MNTRLSPQDVALALCTRSICNVQVGAAISDRQGIFSWGWNHHGDGSGTHAEEFAIRRANRRRLAGSRLTVAAVRKRNGRIICAKPCEERCQKIALRFGIGFIEYTTKKGIWEMIELAYVLTNS